MGWAPHWPQEDWLKSYQSNHNNVRWLRMAQLSCTHIISFFLSSLAHGEVHVQTLGETPRCGVALQPLTPLKNDGLRQLGWWHSQYFWKKKMFQTTNQGKWCSIWSTNVAQTWHWNPLLKKAGKTLATNFQSFAKRPQGPMDQKKNTHPK
jgi:hypothetical protein